MTVTDELLAELEEAASNATGGEWEYNMGLIRTMADSDGYVPVAVAPNVPSNWRKQRDRNMQYIATATPATITALTAELRRLRAENAELERVVNDVRWRVADTTDQLQAYGHNGDRLYGLDEWSVPIRNLNIAIGMLEKATK